MGAMAFETGPGGRLHGYKFDPLLEVLIPGVDTDENHPMYQPDTVKWYKRMLAGEYDDDLNDYVENGQHTPGKVWKDKTTGKAIPIFGRKRTLFLRRANEIRVERGLEPWRFAAVNAEPGLSMADAMLQSITENTHRYHQNALELAEIAFHYIKHNGDSPEVRVKLSGGLRVKERQLDKVLALRSAHTRVRQAIEKEGLKLTAAIALAEMPIEKQAAEFDKLKNQAGGKRITTEAARAAKVGRLAKPTTQKALRFVNVLQGMGADLGALMTYRFLLGDISIEQCGEEVQAAWQKVESGEDKIEAKAAAREAKRAAKASKKGKRSSKNGASKKKNKSRR